MREGHWDNIIHAIVNGDVGILTVDESYLTLKIDGREFTLTENPIREE